MIDLSIFSRDWTPPAIPNEIPHGDMPGDKVSINEGHVAKANVIFPRLLALLPDVLAQNPAHKAVISVCGGSGVGKSETASLLSFYLNQFGIGAYTLSGDNYPHRIPLFNDAERLRVFRVSALRGLIKAGEYDAARADSLAKLMQEEKPTRHYGRNIRGSRPINRRGDLDFPAILARRTRSILQKFPQF